MAIIPPVPFVPVLQKYIQVNLKDSFRQKMYAAGAGTACQKILLSHPPWLTIY